MNPKLKDFLIFLTFAFLGFIIYSNSLESPFLYDDRSIIPYDKWNIIPYYYYLSKNDFVNLLKSLIDSNRPILILSFILNYKIGGLNPFSYHLVNLIFHVLTAFLIYLTIKNITSEKLLIPFLSASVFLVHPIGVESVTYISSRSSILSAFFYMIPFYLLSRRNGKKSNGSLYYVCSLIAYLASLGCKEIGITLPLMLLIYDYFFLSMGDKKRLFRSIKKFHIPLAILALVIIFLKFKFALTLVSPDHTKRELYPHILTEIYIFAPYLIKFFLPMNLNIDPDFPLVSSFLQTQVIISSMILAALILLLWCFRKSSKLISFAIAWTLITISPHFLIRLKDLMAERWLYLSLVGLSFFTDAILLKALNIFQKRTAKIIFRNGILTGLILTIGFFSLLTFKRNLVWNSEVALWSDAVKKSPAKDRPHVNLGKAYFDNGMIKEALAEFKKAIEINPFSGQGHYNLGNCYYRIGRTDDAIAQYKIAVSINPYYSLAYNNLAIAYFSKGLYEEGIRACKEAIETNPFSYQTYYNLGNHYYRIGRTDDAIAQYRIAIEINPYYASAYNNLGVAYFSKGLYQEGISAYKRAIEISPNFAEVYTNLGNAYRKINLIQEAISSYKKALNLRHDLFKPHYMLALSYKEIGDYENAIKEFELCLNYAKNGPLLEDIKKKIKSLRETSHIPFK